MQFLVKNQSTGVTMDNNALHRPPTALKQVLRWYKKAQVDYATHYVHMYIAYNTWYREVTATDNNRQAINALKKRFIIWDEYEEGKVMQSLRPYLEKLVDLTQKEPLRTSLLGWSGEINSVNDWHSLIEFWYQVRCILVHGGKLPSRYVWLAYETLDIFMAEIMDRVSVLLAQYDPSELQRLSKKVQQNKGRVERFSHLQNKLYQKYVASPDIWNVDMRRSTP